MKRVFKLIVFVGLILLLIFVLLWIGKVYFNIRVKTALEKYEGLQIQNADLQFRLRQFSLTVVLDNLTYSKKVENVPLKLICPEISAIFPFFKGQLEISRNLIGKYNIGNVSLTIPQGKVIITFLMGNMKIRNFISFPKSQVEGDFLLACWNENNEVAGDFNFDLKDFINQIKYRVVNFEIKDIFSNFPPLSKWATGEGIFTGEGEVIFDVKEKSGTGKFYFGSQNAILNINKTGILKTSGNFFPSKVKVNFIRCKRFTFKEGIFSLNENLDIVTDVVDLKISGSFDYLRKISDIEVKVKLKLQMLDNPFFQLQFLKPQELKFSIKGKYPFMYGITK